jgi:hypothetical protein
MRDTEIGAWHLSSAFTFLLFLFHNRHPGRWSVRECVGVM